MMKTKKTKSMLSAIDGNLIEKKITFLVFSKSNRLSSESAPQIFIS